MITEPATIHPLIDSHAHLDMEDFDADRTEVLGRAFDAGVRAVLCPLEITSDRSLEVGLSLAEGRTGIVLAAGCHPHQAGSYRPEHEAKIRALAAARQIVGLGEIGLDFHYDFAGRSEQADVFRRQLALAVKLDLPAVIHSREAGRDVIAAVQAEPGIRGVLHCYTEDWETAERLLDAGLFISFSGIITFPKADGLREVASKTPLDRLLVETDSPYLAPVPFRGRRNEPSYVVETANLLARLKGLSGDRLAEAVSRNFKALFAAGRRT